MTTFIGIVPSAAKYGYAILGGDGRLLFCNVVSQPHLVELIGHRSQFRGDVAGISKPWHSTKNEVLSEIDTMSAVAAGQLDLCGVPYDWWPQPKWRDLIWSGGRPRGEDLRQMAIGWAREKWRRPFEGLDAEAACLAWAMRLDWQRKGETPKNPVVDVEESPLVRWIDVNVGSSRKLEILARRRAREGAIEYGDRTPDLPLAEIADMLDEEGADAIVYASMIAMNNDTPRTSNHLRRLTWHLDQVSAIARLMIQLESEER